MAEQESGQSNVIVLSKYTDALMKSLAGIKKRQIPDDYTKLTVSRAVSFVALAYEKVRNAIEYREDHLLRRAAIERIIRRRLSLNPTGENEAENVLRELLWARYFPKNSLGEDDVEMIQKVINTYLAIRDHIVKNKHSETKEYLWSFLIDMMTCEIEEKLSPEVSQREANYTFYIYQTLHNTVKIEDVDSDQKDMLFLIALEKAYRKSDISYQRFHLFNLFYQPLSEMSMQQIETLLPQLPAIFTKIDQSLQNPVVEKLTRFIKKQLPAYLILFELINDLGDKATELIQKKEDLWKEVEQKCNAKYQQVKQKLTGMAVRSLIYIFVTKMIFAIILEYPVSILLYGEAQKLPIIINSLFPPLLMLMIVLWFRLPGKENTVKIYHRIIHIINEDPTFETRVNLITKRVNKKTKAFSFFFTGIYLFTFVITLYIIHNVLNLLDFHLLSQALFIFFISVVSFFAYRIKQVISEYRLIERDSIMAPLIDFFFLPILSLGKIFSNGVSKLNFFTVLFDFIIEAPFKLIIDIIEEWISFMKARKEEIV